MLISLPLEVFPIICSHIDDYRVLGHVSKSLRGKIHKNRRQIADSFQIVRWIDSLEDSKKPYGNPITEFWFLPKRVSWPRSPHTTRFVEVTEGGEVWNCSFLVDPFRGVEVIARNHRMADRSWRTCHQVHVRKWITTLHMLQAEALKAWSAWLHAGLSLQFQYTLKPQCTPAAVSADTRIFRNEVIEPEVLAWLSERRVWVTDERGLFMMYPNDDGTSWAFVRELDKTCRVCGVLSFGRATMDLLYYYNRRSFTLWASIVNSPGAGVKYDWAITGRREGMAQTIANLDWLQNMDKDAWNGVEWAVEIHSNLPPSESPLYKP